MSISLCMIVKNEEKYLEQALASVKDLVDEIIIIDAQSTDKTKEIAKKFTNKIFNVPWNDDFAEARNISLKHATKDWILVLDADEVIAKEDHPIIKELMKDPAYDAYTFIQASYTQDKSQLGFTSIAKRTKETKNFPGYISCNIIRLFRNKKGIHFSNPVHESVDDSIQNKQKVRVTDLKIHHYQFEKGEQNQREKQLQYLHIYESKAEKFTNKAKLYRDMGIIYASFKQNYEKAIACFKKSLTYNPSNLKTYIGLIQCYHQIKKIAEAKEMLQEAEKRFPKSPEVQRLKQILLRA